MTLISNPRVIDISSNQGKKWMPKKITPEFRLYAQQSVVHTLSERSKELREKVCALHATVKPIKMVSI